MSGARAPNAEPRLFSANRQVPGVLVSAGRLCVVFVPVSGESG
jgi:hypothetical protein